MGRRCCINRSRITKRDRCEKGSKPAKAHDSWDPMANVMGAVPLPAPATRAKHLSRQWKDSIYSNGKAACLVHDECKLYNSRFSAFRIILGPGYPSAATALNIHFSEAGIS